MKWVIVVCSILSLLSSGVIEAQTFKAIGEVVTPDRQGLAVGTHCIAMMDAGNYRQFRREMAERVRLGGTISDEEFVASMKTRRAPLGRPMSRVLFRARFSKTLRGAPDGNYEFLDYRTALEHKKQAFETVTLTKESGHWQVSGYHVW